MSGLQAIIGESVQSMVTPGSCIDTFYAGISNVEKQCFPSRVQNKFYIDFNSKNPGSTSVVTFNPNQGVTDIVVELQLPDLSGVVGLVANRGWGYKALKNISVRYGTAPQYFIASEQHLLSVLEQCDNATKRDQVFALGGPAMATAGALADLTNRTAYVYIKLFHNTPSIIKHLPYPTDLTTQPLQLTFELEDWSKLFVGGSAIPSNLQQFSVARVNFRQVELNNTNDLLAHRQNMSEKMYIYPLQRFEQRQVPIPVSGSGQSQSVQLTGFRSGEVSHIVLMAVDNADLANGNALNGQPLANVVLTVNGDVRYDARDQSSILWDLVTRAQSASWANTYWNGSAQVASTGYYLIIPMGQEANTLANEYELTHGYSVMNSVLNLQLQLPVSANGYTLYATYWYRSCLGITNGNVDYIF
jgi:hypothetical protein